MCTIVFQVDKNSSALKNTNVRLKEQLHQVSGLDIVHDWSEKSSLFYLLRYFLPISV